MKVSIELAITFATLVMVVLVISLQRSKDLTLVMER